MTAKSLDVFSLRDSVVGEYKKFATSFTTIHAEDIRQQVEAIYAQERYWPEPLIQINPSYKRSTSIETLVAGGVLESRCAEIFRMPPTTTAPRGEPLALYKHQEQAIALASQGESFVVTTGTGSGKSLCFFIPIVNAVLSEKRAGGAKRTRAIVIYPMNALANSQLEELDKFVENVPGDRPVTFARYTGQEDAEERRHVSENPPDILLTNFMMLELLMTRQDELDRRVIGNCAGLRFLVLDELHTYRGRQGADVALLVSRVRERLAPERLQCIGTSATMASEGSLEDKSRVVARVASKLFSIEIPDSNVIVETLERVTDGRATARRLAAEGMQICVVDLQPDAAAAIAEEIGGLAIGADVSDPAALADAFERCLAELGRLDVAHLNAGVSLPAGDIADLHVENYRRSIAVNVDHVVFGTGAAVRAMRRTAADGGPRAVVATASLAGIDPFLPNAIYTLTKHAVVGFLRALAPDLATDGIAAHVICPGLTDTAQLPPDRKEVLLQAGARVGDAARVADAVVAAITAPLDATGTCWIVHPDEPPLPWAFAEVPGPHHLFNLTAKRSQRPTQE